MNTAAQTALISAFSAHEEAVASAAFARVTGLLAKIKEAHGPMVKGVYGCWTFSKVWSQTVKPVSKIEGYKRSLEDWNNPSGEYVLDEEKAWAWARAWAKQELSAAAQKLQGKLGGLYSVRFKGSVEGGMFTLLGVHPNGAPVRVEQSRILNVSKNGTLFNQWPALIYVDGKRISEAAYKRLSPRPEDRVLPELKG